MGRRHKYTQDYTAVKDIYQSPKMEALAAKGYRISSIVKYWGDINGDGISDPLLKFKLTHKDNGDMKIFMDYVS